jgi:hypothetical protein
VDGQRRLDLREHPLGPSEAIKEKQRERKARKPKPARKAGAVVAEQKAKKAKKQKTAARKGRIKAHPKSKTSKEKAAVKQRKATPKPEFDPKKPARFQTIEYKPGVRKESKEARKERKKKTDPLAKKRKGSVLIQQENRKIKKARKEAPKKRRAGFKVVEGGKSEKPKPPERKKPAQSGKPKKMLYKGQLLSPATVKHMKEEAKKRAKTASRKGRKTVYKWTGPKGEKKPPKTKRATPKLKPNIKTRKAKLAKVGKGIARTVRGAAAGVGADVIGEALKWWHTEKSKTNVIPKLKPAKTGWDVSVKVTKKKKK